MSNRPTSMRIDATVYWTIMTYDADGVLVDADSTPTVAVRKNGSSVADAVTVTKRSATTGIYDVSYNPASELDGDTFGFEETVTLSAQAYLNSWSLEVDEMDKTTAISASFAALGSYDAATHTDVDNSETAISNFITGVNNNINSLNDFDPAADTVANVTTVQTTVSNTDMRGTDSALLASSAPANWSLMDIDGVGAITTSNPAAGGGSAHTAEDVRDLILGGDKSTISMASNKVANVVLVDTTTDLTNGGAGGGDATAANQTAILANIAALNDISVDDIYDEPKSNQIAAGSFGQLLNNVYTFTSENYNTVNNLDGMLEPTGVGGYQFTALAVENAPVADVSGLSTFDSTTDQVVASNMRGTDGANTVAPDNASIAAILADTDNLQSNQGNWLTADVSGLSTQSSVDALQVTADAVLADTDDLQTHQGDWVTADVSGLATQASVDAIDSNVENILDDTNELQLNQNNWLTATTTVSSNMRGTDDALLASSAPVRFSSLIIGDGADLGKVTTSNPAAGSGSSHTAQDVANLILAGDQSPIVTSSGAVANVVLTATTTDLTNQSAGGTNPADIYSYFTDGTREDAFKADVSGLSTSAEVQSNGLLILGLNDFDPANDVVARVTLTDTTTNLTNGGSGGGDSAADIYTYFTASNREEAFKATGFNTVAPDNASISAILADTSDLQANQDQWLTASGFATPTDVSASTTTVLATIDALNDFDPNSDVVQDVNTVQTVISGGGSGGGGGTVTVKATPTPRAF